MLHKHGLRVNKIALYTGFTFLNRDGSRHPRLRLLQQQIVCAGHAA